MSIFSNLLAAVQPQPTAEMHDDVAQLQKLFRQRHVQPCPLCGGQALAVTKTMESTSRRPLQIEALQIEYHCADCSLDFAQRWAVGPSAPPTLPWSENPTNPTAR